MIFQTIKTLLVFYWDLKIYILKILILSYKILLQKLKIRNFLEIS